MILSWTAYVLLSFVVAVIVSVYFGRKNASKDSKSQKKEKATTANNEKKKIKRLQISIPKVSKVNGSLYLDGLDDDSLLHIFNFLDDHSLCILSQVCKRFREISSDNTIWKHRFFESHQFKFPSNSMHYSSTLLLNTFSNTNMNDKNTNINSTKNEETTTTTMTSTNFKDLCLKFQYSETNWKNGPPHETFIITPEFQTAYSITVPSWKTNDRPKWQQNKRLLLSGTADGNIQFWNWPETWIPPETGRPSRSLRKCDTQWKAHRGPIASLDCSDLTISKTKNKNEQKVGEDHDSIVNFFVHSSSSVGSLALFKVKCEQDEPATQEEILRIDDAHLQGKLSCSTLSSISQQQRILSCGYDGTIKLWNCNEFESENPISCLSRVWDLSNDPLSTTLKSVTFLNNSSSGVDSLIACGSAGGMLFVFDPRVNHSNKPIASVTDMSGISCLGADREYIDNSNCFFSGHLDGIVRKWDLRNLKQQINVLEKEEHIFPQHQINHKARINCIKHSYSTNRMLSVCYDGLINVYDVENEILSGQMKYTNIIYSIWFDQFNALTGSLGGAIKIWHLLSKRD